MEEVLKLFLAGFERSKRRDWARNLKPGDVNLDSAVENVVSVLSEQLTAKAVFDGPGKAAFQGVLACKEVFGTLFPSDEQIENAIERAQEDHMVVCALQLLAHTCPTGQNPHLDRWKTGLFLEAIPIAQRPKGPSPFGLSHRDMLIVNQIKQLAVVGFNPTRNSLTKRNESGCDIVSTATHHLGRGSGMTYVAVEGVWKRHRAPTIGNFGNEILDQFAAYLERRRKR